MNLLRIAWIAFFAFMGTVLVGCTSASKFPGVDPSKLRITLERSACYGSCPDYAVTIAGDGRVDFTTQEMAVDDVSAVHRQFSETVGVLVTGRHSARIDPAKVQALVQKFREAGFFRLRDEYRADITDNPTYVISIDTGHGSKRVIDYVGKEVGMPSSVTALEDAIDETAGTARWIEGTADVIPLLQAEGARFDNDLGLKLMAAAAQRDDVETMERLRKLGAPIAGNGTLVPLEVAAASNRKNSLSWLLDRGAGNSPEPLSVAFEAAVFERLRPLMDRNGVSPELATNLLRSAAENGNVPMVAHFLGLHPQLNGSADDRAIDDPPLFKAAQNSCPDDRPHPNCDHRKVVKMLLDAGAEARWFHPIYRKSVFFLVNDVEIAKMLLAKGADPNFKDSDGEPIIFSVSDEDVALAMLDAGASLRAIRPADKMTLRGWAAYQKWPRVLARLDRAGI